MSHSSTVRTLSTCLHHLKVTKLQVGDSNLRMSNVKTPYLKNFSSPQLSNLKPRLSADWRELRFFSTCMHSQSYESAFSLLVVEDVTSSDQKSEDEFHL